MTGEKALFIPLTSEHYESFKSGIKAHELRKYGPRWNERVCCIGRFVTLSKGYGKSNRLAGVVTSFAKIKPQKIGGLNRIAMQALYGNLDFDIADIGIEVWR